MYIGSCWGYVALPCFVFCAVGIFDEIHNIRRDWIIFLAFTVIFLVPRMWIDADAHPSNMKLCHLFDLMVLLRKFLNFWRRVYRASPEGG